MAQETARVGMGAKAMVAVAKRGGEVDVAGGDGGGWWRDKGRG